MIHTFNHLHCHSHYSLLDGASRIPELVRHVQSLGMSALALTDHGNLHGALEFLREAKAAGIKPVLGMEAYVAPFGRSNHTPGGCSGREHNFHLTLLARDGEGFRNLMRLSSAAFLEGFYYKPRIDKEILERHAAGLICLSGCVSSEFSDHLLNGQRADAERLCAWYAKVFGPGRFYVEIQANGLAIQREHAEAATDLARRMGLPLVATSDAHYLLQSDAEVHDILLCINTARSVDDPGRMRFETDQFHVRSPAEMTLAFPGHAEALAESGRIAATVEDHYESLKLGTRQFPSFATPGGMSPEAYLRDLCEAGLQARYGPAPAVATVGRLEHEIGIINRMGFASYFLIVWDFVRYAREHDIPYSARGSACGALVSYLLYLSHVDPLAHDLLFERFLDPNRADPPDIDVDLCRDRRAEVIAYVRAKYGAENVAQIGTFGTLGARAAIRDVGRALGVPLARVARLARMVPAGPNVTLAWALNTVPELRQVRESDPALDRLFGHALRLEGTARSVGTHAAGVVVAGRPLRDLVPLQAMPGRGPEAVSTQWEMGDVERAGLLKMDFLGLRNLTALQAAVRLVNGREPGRIPDINRIPLDDPETYAMLRRGEARGVFQLDGGGIRDLLVRMRPDRFADLVAILALYRPGPLDGGMVDEYVEVKHGRKEPSYPHPVLEDVLAETYGVMVYQEQVMRILERLGGIPLAQAYACIKAISKKKADAVARSRDQFVDGAAARGLARDDAALIFGRIEFFGGYGFNKSHATAYAFLAYQTAYLKAHHPAAFMAALLTSDMGGPSLSDHVDDCRRMGIEVLPPDVNAGSHGFALDDDGRITFGLGAVRGLGAAAQVVERARSDGGPFRDLDDFLSRVPVGRSCVDTLIRAGAFDSLARATTVPVRKRPAPASPPPDPGPPPPARSLLLSLDRDRVGPDAVDRLLAAVRASPGDADLYLEVRGLPGVRRALYKAGFRVMPGPALEDACAAVLGPGNARAV